MLKPNNDNTKITRAWTGPREDQHKLILRWLPPIPVGVEDGEGPAVIHKVK